MCLFSYRYTRLPLEKVDKHGMSFLDLYFYNIKDVDINHVKSLLSEWILTKVDNDKRSVLSNYLLSRCEFECKADPEIIKLLISEIAITTVDKHGKYPLSIYIRDCYYGTDSKIIKMLFHKDLIITNNLLNNYVESKGCDIEIMKMLLRSEKDLLYDKYHYYPLGGYIRKGGEDPEIVKLLSHPSILTHDKYGFYPLRMYIERGGNNLEIIKLLSHPSILTPDKYGNYPLRIYLERGGDDIWIIRMLYHPSILTPDKYGNYPLKFYIEKGGNNPAIVKLLFRKDIITPNEYDHLVRCYVRNGGNKEDML